MKPTLDTILSSPIYAEMRTPLFLRAVEKNPHWANDLIQEWDEQHLSDAKNFLRRHYWTSQGSVNVFQVIGTAHQQYQNRPWIDLLTTGKRMDINLPLQAKNPNYYRETQPKQPMMYFNTFDGINYYIGSDGNHRTCIAKFMFYETGETQIHGVTINHYDIDENFYQLYLELNRLIKILQLPVILSVESKKIKREDTAGWMIDYFQPYLIWTDYSKVNNEEKLTLNFSQTQQKLNELQSIISESKKGFLSLLKKLFR